MADPPMAGARMADKRLAGALTAPAPGGDPPPGSGPGRQSSPRVRVAGAEVRSDSVTLRPLVGNGPRPNPIAVRRVPDSKTPVRLAE